MADQPEQVGKVGCCTPGSEQCLSQPDQIQRFKRQDVAACVNLGADLGAAPTRSRASCPGAPLTCRWARRPTAGFGLLPGKHLDQFGIVDKAKMQTMQSPKREASLLSVYLTQVPVLPFLSHWTFLLLSVVPVPQDTEQLDQLLHGSDAGRAGAVGRTQLGGFSVSFMKKNGEPSVSTNTNANLAAELMLIR